MQEPVNRATMNKIFALCRADDWIMILDNVKENPLIATTSMIMDNHISTTILHQAITSKAKTQDRSQVIQHILKVAPKAAFLRNGYGSLPLHVITQRNTKMDSQTKEHLIHHLIKACPEALMEQGGVGKRTPLHIAFTDYISPQLARMMIDRGIAATSMKDKKGWLPVHVAVSRHCSPEKLRMLLNANPESLYAKTERNESLLDLAKSTATKSHPNFALIFELQKCLGIVDDDAREPVGEKSKRRRTTATVDFDDEPIAYPQELQHVTRKRKSEAAELLLNLSRRQDEEVPVDAFESCPTPIRITYPVMHPRHPGQDYHHPSQVHVPSPHPHDLSPLSHALSQRRVQHHRHHHPHGMMQKHYPGHERPYYPSQERNYHHQHHHQAPALQQPDLQANHYSRPYKRMYFEASQDPPFYSSPVSDPTYYSSDSYEYDEAQEQVGETAQV